VSTSGGWRVELAPSAGRDLKRLDPPIQARILAALDGLAVQPPVGDIKRLSGQPPEWRLRVGDWRVRFTRDPATRTVLIQRVLPRGRAYRD
jgi:mRNA interferase RelE/StbE